MANIEFKIDDARLNQVLKDLGDDTQDLTPAMKQVGEYMRFRTEENFRGEQTPEGIAWLPLKPSTVARKTKKKSSINKILQDTGDLRGSIAYQTTPRRVTIGTNTMVGGYSLGAIHQFGAAKRNIPARPFLGASDSDIDEIVQIILDHLTENW